MSFHQKIKHHRGPKFMNNILDDIFHPCAPVCQIIPTDTKKKKDVFERYRPRPKTCLDWNISQTDTKMDAGDTKIHYESTVAHYYPELTEPKEPPPKKVKGIKYFSGGPPQWGFIDEKWMHQQIEAEKIHKKQFKIRVVQRKRYDRMIMNSAHGRALRRVGPAWYQELSPKQIRAVDNLKNCILKDLGEGTIINTQENIGELGLVLRPNHRHVKKALHTCCKCPVEFLLILYQLIEPNRTKYSINDRLLLSAVVHLSLMRTLKELHIRIPSPPRPPKVTKTMPKKKKKMKYESPYLEPFTFKKEPPKFTGTYTNKHVQRPESPYFCYLSILRQMQKEANMLKGGTISIKSSKTTINGPLLSTKATKRVSVSELAELEEELRVAQSTYETLVDFRPVPTLLRASKYVPCDNFRNRAPPISEEDGEEEEEEEEAVSACYVPECCDAETEIEEELSGTCECPPKSTCSCASSKSKCHTDEKSCYEPKEEECCECGTPKSSDCCERQRGGGCSNPTCPNRPKKDEVKNPTSCGCNAETDRNKNVDLKMYPIIKSKRKCECREQYKELIEKPLCQCEKCVEDREKKNTNYVIAGMKETDASETVPIIDRLSAIKPCDCLRKYRRFLEEYEKEKEEMGDRVCSCISLEEPSEKLQSSSSEELDEEKWCFCGQLNRCLKKLKRKVKLGDVSVDEEKEICEHAKNLAAYEEMYYLIRPNKIKKKKCTCKEQYRELIEKPLCQCEKCEEERKKNSINYVIAGQKETEARVTSIIDRVAVQKPCICLKKYKEAIKKYEKEKAEEKSPCECRGVTKKIIDTPLCPCEKCEADRKKKAAKFIIAGIKETEGEKPHVIAGISMGTPCRCVKEYQKRIKQYEEFCNRKKVLADVKETMRNEEKKFIISGVHSTPKGPVYVISGMRPQINCICGKRARQEAAEAHMRTIMPEAPKGRIQYGIVGVKETPDKNYYILNSALPIEDCDCMAVYNKFKEQHAICLDMYDEYLAQMRDEYNEFMKEMLPPSSTRSSMASSYKPSTPVEKEEVVNKVAEKESQVTEEVVGVEEQQSKVLVEEEEETPITKKSCKSVCEVKSCQPVCCLCGNPYYSLCCQCGQRQKIDCKECTCGGQVIECVDCTCGIEEEEKVEEEVEEEEPKLKRYFIYKKILCNTKWQIRVIRKALNSMAEDEFPLAKLPHSYKLPHFKLWMQMRCRKFWTLQEKIDSILLSKSLWRHLDHCTIWDDPFPRVPIGRADAGELDWSKADYVRRIVFDTFERYYRRIKQNRINHGREFFPTTFTYEFPFKTWRDCYFSYIPTQEQEVLPRFVWQKYDYKHFADMKRFCG